MSGPILVWGAGAIGANLGASFQRQGEEVVFVDAAADHVAAMKAGGLHITGPIEDFTIPVTALGPDEVRGPFERVVLAVKAHHTAGAIQALATHLSPSGYVLSAQNGLNERVIARAVGEARTMGCFVNFGADYLSPGTVHYSGRGAVVVGEMDGRRSERVEAMHRLLLGFDDRAVLTENISGYLWGKLIYGALLFATALTDDSIADVLAKPEHRPILTKLAHEVGAVASREGIALESFDGFDPQAFLPTAPAETTARSFDDMVAHNRRSAKSHSGIWRDLAIRKRRTEVDAQLGPIVEVGAGHGMATPITARLVAMIHEIEDGHRPLARENLAELSRVTEGQPA